MMTSWKSPLHPESSLQFPPVWPDATEIQDCKSEREVVFVAFVEEGES